MGVKLKLKVQVPKEDVEQATLFSWAEAFAHKYPELKLMFATLNGVPLYGPYKWQILAKLRQQGMRKGVPDVVIPCMRRSGKDVYGALFVEMKRVRFGRASQEQLDFMSALCQAGYHVVMVKGAREAISAIESYLNLDRP